MGCRRVYTKKRRRNREDVAEDHLQDLIHRNMIQVTDKSLDERVMSSHMHDLLQDLAISEAKDTKKFE